MIHETPVPAGRPGRRRGKINRHPTGPVMRYLLLAGVALLAARPAAAIDPESRTPYHLRLAVRTGDHKALTPHFRADVTRAVTSALQAALGTLGTVEAVDLNTLPA